MSEQWLQDYMLLAFRIDKIAHNTYNSEFVESYYGPPEWKQLAEAEPVLTPNQLVREAMSLADSLAAQAFPVNRATYLGKQLRAMETICRKWCGETFPLQEEIERCLDVHLDWTPESLFEKAHALYDESLPGSGSMKERVEAWNKQVALPQEHSKELDSYILAALAEARKRTLALTAFPERETIDLHLVPDWEHEGAAYYEGNYRSYIKINLTTAAKNLARLFDHLICHEGYPGHHTEYILKEQHVYRQQGCVEQTAYLTLCPQCVISEGIAMMAHEMIFVPGEAEQWMAEHVYAAFQIEVDPQALLKMRKATEMLEGVWGNAMLLLGEGRSDEEVAEYFTKYMLYSEENSSRLVAFLKQPVTALSMLSYQCGQSLMRPLLQGPDRASVFRRLLTEQVTPSQLASSQWLAHTGQEHTQNNPKE